MDGTNTISGSSYATRRRQLMKLISSLRALGAQADLDLPRIVCVGNQSAGKSSLVEAISGIRVPRDSGTCTRCPMECRLSSSEDAWSAKISLRIEFDRKGKRLPKPEVVDFAQASPSPSSTELDLRRAQTAILNWGEHPAEKFLTMTEEELRAQGENSTQLKFSKNPVCLDISGPNLTELVFIDLPGLIQNADDESTIGLVENMVVEQIQGNSIILVTLPMSDDLENQKAALLAKKADPEGRRTIGVLTKPDMLTLGATRSRESWLDVIEGRKHSLSHGYYCTRQPEDSERVANITLDETRKREANFFAKTAPWSNSSHKDRFGIPSLTAKLSSLLSRKIDESLPKIQEDIKKILENTNSQLATLPPPLSDDPSTELLNLVAGFSSALGDSALGALGSEKLVQDNFKAYRTFKIAIRRTAPVFRPFVSQAVEDAAYDEDDAANVVGDEPLPAGYSLLTGPMYLKDLRAHIQRAVTRELPNNVPFGAKVALIDQFTSKWQTPIEQCFQTVEVRVLSTLMELMSSHFGRFANLTNVVRSLVMEDVNQCKMRTSDMLQILLSFEEMPYTQNDHYYHACRDKFLAHYKAVRSGRLEDGPSPSKKKVLPQSRPSAASTPTSNNVALPANPFSFGGTSAANQTSAPASQFGSQFGGAFGSSSALIGASFAPPAEPSSASPFLFSGLGTSSSGGINFSTLPSVSLGAKSSKANSFTKATEQAATSVPVTQTPTFGEKAPVAATATASTNVSASIHDPELQNDALAALAKLGYTGLTAEDLDKLLPSDEFEVELTVAAEAIDTLFLKALARGMQSSLISRLGLGDKVRAAALVAEDENTVAKREDLMMRKKRLESVREELLKFGYY